MTRVQAFWSAVGIAVGAHAWILTDRGPSGGGVRRQPLQGHAPGGVRLRWIALVAPPPAPASPAKLPPPRTRAPDVTGLARAEAESAATSTVPTPGATPAEHFWRPSEVDFRALPLQPPDTAPLDGRPWVADQPVRLRLSIDARGKVVDVASRDTVQPPADLLDAFATLFKATPFLPARRRGQNVASLQDIEILPACSASAPCNTP